MRNSRSAGCDPLHPVNVSPRQSQGLAVNKMTPIEVKGFKMKMRPYKLKNVET